MKKVKNFFRNKILNFLTSLVKEKNDFRQSIIELGLGLTAPSIRKLQEEVAELKEKLTPKKIQEINDPSLLMSPDGRFQIRIEKESRDHITFHTSMPILTEDKISVNFYDFEFPKTIDGSLRQQCPETLRSFLNSAYETKNCVSLTFKPFSITIEKTPAVKWENLMPGLTEKVFNFLAEKYPIEKEEVQ